MVLFVEPGLLRRGRVHLLMALHTVSDARRQVLHRRIRLIVAVTIGYNMVEAIIAITAGTVASSAALVGFGLDSTIEVLSAAAVAWQFTRRDPERWEKPTLRVIAVAFFALAVYVTATSVAALVAGVDVQHSTVGIVLTAAQCRRDAVPVLRRTARRTRGRLGNRGRRLQADAGLHLPVRRGPGRARPEQHPGLVVCRLDRRLVIAAFAVREGVEAWKGDACATSVGMILEDDHEA